MKLVIPKGSTSYSIDVFVRDTSATSGVGLAGLVFDSAGLVAYYHRPGAAAVAITLATLAAVTTAWATGGFKEVEATNMKGVYRLDLPNAVLASGVEWATVMLSGVANMAPVTVEIQLSDAVRGLGAPTAVPNVAAGAAGAIATSTTGAGSVPQTGDAYVSAALAADIAEGDETIDKVTDPAQWRQVVKRKATSVELVRKKLFESDGTTKVAADSQIVGKRTET